MTRKIIQIDQEKCVGCGLCANTCKQSAIEIIDGKAKVVGDDSCDGIGNCMPVCPVGAISFSDRDIKNKQTQTVTPAFSCPGTMAKSIATTTEDHTYTPDSTNVPSRLGQWPVQIKLVPTSAPYFHQANLLVAADCTAFAYGDFHNRFMKNKITIIGCPKLDEGDYTEKLTEIIKNNELKSVTIARMEVPCCGGLQNATINALKNSGKFIPWQVVTISTNGHILED